MSSRLMSVHAQTRIDWLILHSSKELHLSIRNIRLITLSSDTFQSENAFTRLKFLYSMLIRQFIANLVFRRFFFHFYLRKKPGSFIAILVSAVSIGPL